MGMSTIAAGTYIKTLREALGLSRDELAHHLGTNGVQVFRIEKGEVDTRSSMLVAIVKYLKGSLDQIGELLLNERATAEDGERMALAWMSQEEKAEVDHFIANASDEQFQEALRLLDKISQREGMDYPLGVLRALVRERD